MDICNMYCIIFPHLKAKHTDQLNNSIANIHVYLQNYFTTLFRFFVQLKKCKTKNAQFDAGKNKKNVRIFLN